MATEVDRKLEEQAHHEAGHAVQAYDNGLGVLSVALEQAYVRTEEQDELENEGISLLNPPELTERLIEFYRRDIEVRIAGPLASYRYCVESSGALGSTEPKNINLTLWGGALDYRCAWHEAKILNRERAFSISEYLSWVQERIWSELVCADSGWGQIRSVAEALLARKSLDRRGFTDVFGTVADKAGRSHVV